MNKKYVVKVVHGSGNGEYISTESDTILYRPNCMCYRLAKMKWFDSIDDAENAIGKLTYIPFKYCSTTERVSLAIHEAIIGHYTNDYGKKYTTVDAGDVVKIIDGNLYKDHLSLLAYI